MAIDTKIGMGIICLHSYICIKENKQAKNNFLKYYFASNKLLLKFLRFPSRMY